MLKIKEDKMQELNYKNKITDLEQENQQLKQQLAEKEKEISNLNGLVRERDKQIKNLKTNKKRVIEHKNKTKISFAVEQLEKVKDIILNERKITSFNFDIFNKGKDTALFWLNEQIDNQIKQLKEGK